MWGPKGRRKGGHRAEVGDALGIIGTTNGIHKLCDLSQLLIPSRKRPESEDHFSISQLQDTSMELLNMTFLLMANSMVSADFMEL